MEQDRKMSECIARSKNPLSQDIKCESYYYRKSTVLPHSSFLSFQINGDIA